MLETTVWQKFWTTWPCYAKRVEPGGGDFDSGFPDVHVLDRKGRIGFLELKRPDKVELNKNQWAWHEEFSDNGGRSCVVTCMTVVNRNKVMWQVFVPDFKKRELVLLKQNLLFPLEMVEVVAQRLRLEV